jgi:hypothetical protein
MKPLRTAIDAPGIRHRIAAAFDASVPGGQHDPRQGSRSVYYEHGQHWITCEWCGAQWAVHDATGPGTVDGFDFERVTEGDETCAEPGVEDPPARYDVQDCDCYVDEDSRIVSCRMHAQASAMLAILRALYTAKSESTQALRREADHQDDAARAILRAVEEGEAP